MTARTFRLILPAAALLLLACTPPNKWKIVSKMDLETPRGEPQITAVEDLGSAPLILNKPLPRAKGDGVAVVGELLVIRGKNLGRQPMVTFGTKPTSVLARTEDGGIVIRAPRASTPGRQRITVSHDRGSGGVDMTLRRYGLAILPGVPGVQVLNVTAHKVVPLGKPLLATAPGFLTLDRHGSVAYATTGGRTPRLLVIDLAAAGGPKLISQRKLGMWRVLGLSAASEAKVLAVVHKKAILLFDLDDPRDPLRYNPARLPSGVFKAGVVDVQLSPDGKTLALLVAQSNSLVLFDVSNPNQVRHTGFLPLLPGAKQTLVRSLRFTFEPRSRHRQVLWVAVGDTPASQRVGQHPPRLIKLGVTPAPDTTVLPKITRLASASIPGQRTPVAMASSYAVAQVVSASVLRRDPSRMTFFLSMLHPELLKLATDRLDTPTGLQHGAEMLTRLGRYTTLLKADHLGRGTSFHQGAEVISSLAVTGDGRFLLGLSCRPTVSISPPKVEIGCGLLLKPTEQGPAIYTPMGKLPISSFVPPFHFGQILVQP